MLSEARESRADDGLWCLYEKESIRWQVLFLGPNRPHPPGLPLLLEISVMMGPVHTNSETMPLYFVHTCTFYIVCW